MSLQIAASHPFRIASVAALLAALLLGAPARAAESEVLTRAKADVAYEHDHLGVIGGLFCKSEVKWMDDQLAALVDAFQTGRVDKIDQHLAYLRSAIDDVRRAEDSRTTDVAIFGGLFVLVGAGAFF